MNEIRITSFLSQNICYLYIMLFFPSRIAMASGISLFMAVFLRLFNAAESRKYYPQSSAFFLNGKPK